MLCGDNVFQNVFHEISVSQLVIEILLEKFIADEFRERFVVGP